ncbi:MAG: hypothetical protein KDA87_23930, partial [Planctomycetales bacterium]|nr:hypothetical protein [Planctomycetales bacterium]
MFRLTLMILSAGIISSALAQVPEGVVIQQEGRPRGRPNPAEASSPKVNESGANQGPPNGKEGPPGGEGASESPADETVRRPNKSAAEFDLDQLKTIRPDGEGRIQLNLRAVPWPPLIEWLGHISAMSVDWRELPADSINLQTQQEYTVADVRDLVNRHLLARGFTMLEDGELLTVEKIQGINSAMVPRLLPDDLESHRDFEFAKTSFELTSLVAEQAAKEFQPLVSRNGTITAFNSTNRLEVMDTVKNLRQIYRLLQQEQDPQHRDYVREFELEHISAAMAKSKLESLLSMEKPTSPANARMSRQQRQQQEMMMQMQMQQMQQNGGQPPPSNGPKPMEVSFVTSDR